MSPYGRFERSPGAEFVTREQDLPSDAANPALLEQVLRQTLAAMTASQRVAPAEMEALKSVGQRHSGRPLDESIAAEMVQAVLCQQPDSTGQLPQIWQTTSLRVAQLLLDDPEANARLTRMWAELGGGSP